MRKSIATLALLGLFLTPVLAGEPTPAAGNAAASEGLQPPANSEVKPVNKKARKKRAKKARKQKTMEMNER